MFKAHRDGYEDRLPSPQGSPSNDTTRLASSLVYTLRRGDIRYDTCAFGDKLLPNIPAQVGADPTLDACVSAMMALYRARHHKQPKVDALAEYGKALGAMTKTIQNPLQPYNIKMQTVSVMFICQVSN